MKILYLTPFVPGEVRPKSFNLLPRLARRHQVALLCLGDRERDADKLRVLEGFVAALEVVGFDKGWALPRTLAALFSDEPLRLAYFRSPRVRTAIAAAIERFRPDVIYCERRRMGQLIAYPSPVPVVCDPTDSMVLYNRRLRQGGRWWQRLIGAIEEGRFRGAEMRLARRFAATVFCSRLDLEAVGEDLEAAGLAAEARLEVIGNGVDTGRFTRKLPSEELGQEILFTGSFTYAPNLSAVEWFLSEVFPRVRRSVPTARLRVVGNLAPERLGRWRAEPGVTIDGFVPSLRPAIARARVAVAPIRFGVGVTNKVLEAMAVGTPVVATRLACGDLPVRDGEHLLLAEEAEAFAAAVVRLLGDEPLRRALARRAGELIASQYDWETIVAQYEALMEELARPSAPAVAAGCAALTF